MIKRSLMASGFAGAALIAAPVMNMDNQAEASEWSGFYIGAHVGGMFGDVDVTNVSEATNYYNLQPGSVLGFSPEGVLGGAQLGYNFAFPNWLIGIELTGSGMDFDETRQVPIGDVESLSVEAEWLATAAARIGFIFNQTSLIYAKGGYAAANIKSHFEDHSGGPSTTGFFDTDETHSGFVVGAGIEHMLSENVSLGVEYNYVDLGETDHSAIASGGGGGLVVNNIEAQVHVVTARLNWHLYQP